MMAMTDLSRELSAYERLLPSLLPNEGKFAVIDDDDLVGVYDSYVDALDHGYKALGVKSFLVKLISSIEVAANYTRDIATECTSAPPSDLQGR